MRTTRTRPLLAAAAALAVIATGVGGAPSATAAQEAAPTTIRVITHNLAKKPGALSAVITKANGGGPEVVLLQEVCKSMLDRVKGALGRQAAWHDRRTGHCGDGSDIGEVAVWTGGDVLDTTAPDFTTSGDQRYGAACVTFRFGGKKNKACSTHLAAGDGAGATRAAATNDLRTRAAGWMADGTRVIVGGDFNAEPKTGELSAVYGVGTGAAGSFRELHQMAKPTTVRTGKVTLWQRKIDYIFGSMSGFGTQGGTEQTCNSTVRDPQGCTPSNHRIVWGTLPLA